MRPKKIKEDPEAAEMRPAVQAAFENRFTIGRSITTGSSGLIFLLHPAEAPEKTPPPLVVKVLRQSLLNHPNIVRDFRSEAAKSEHLTHPNLIKIDRVGTIKLPRGLGAPNYTMEYVEGPRLDDYLKGVKSSEERLDLICEAFSQMLDVLTYLQKFAVGAPIFHLDIKASNIHVRRDEATNIRLKLLDFGGAKVRTGIVGVGRTEIQTTLGNMPRLYMKFLERIEDPKGNRTIFMMKRAGMQEVGASIDLHQLAKMLAPEIAGLIALGDAAKLSRDREEKLQFLAELLRRMDLDDELSQRLHLLSYPPAERYVSASEVQRSWALRESLATSSFARFGRGSIRLPGTDEGRMGKAIVDIINTTEFKRLRLIKQNDFAEFVYPGATHNRFEHSVGVFSKAATYLTALTGPDSQPLFRSLVTEDELRATVLIALLHDIGHYPFAHTIHDFRPFADHEGDSYQICTQEPICDLIAACDVDMGVFKRLMQFILRLNPDSAAPLSKAHSKKDDLDVPRHWHVLRAVISGPIDADKLDYLVRDSTHAGVPYGAMIDQQLLIRSLVTYVEDDGTLRLGVSDKGRATAEMFAVCRYAMYGAIYWHHTVRAFIAMLRHAMGQISEGNLLDLYESRFELSSREFLIGLKEKFRANKFSSLVNDLINRSPYRRVLVLQDTVEGQREVDNYERHLYAPLLEKWRKADSRKAIIGAVSGIFHHRFEPHQVLLDCPTVKDIETLRAFRESAAVTTSIGPMWKASYDDLASTARLRIYIDRSVKVGPIKGDKERLNALKKLANSIGVSP